MKLCLQLKEKNIQPDTPIWEEGFPDWVMAGEVEELRMILVKTPPVYKKAAKKTRDLANKCFHLFFKAYLGYDCAHPVQNFIIRRFRYIMNFEQEMPQSYLSEIVSWLFPPICTPFMKKGIDRT